MKGKTTFLAKASMMLFAVLFSFTSARADEFTVYADGEATSQYVPVEGYWADSYQKCEFVIAQAKLTPMAGSAISKMTFYLSTPAAAAWGGNFQVFVKEVSETTISAFSGTEGATIVYEGPLDGTGSTMVIDFNAPYTYNGGNLLVGVYETEKGAYKSAAFAGAAVDGASIQGHSGNSLDEVTANQKNFVPKTTFTYFAAGALMPPTGLKVNYDGGLEATISWASDESLFDIDVNDVVTENITDNPYTLTGLDYGTTYTVKVRAKKGEEVSDWSGAVTFTTEYAAFSLPYLDSFEEGIGPWTLVNCTSGTGVGSTSQTGSNGFQFYFNSNPPQYLISPEFDGGSAMAVSFWYMIKSTNYPETFQVGYSTTTKAIDAFTWGDEVTATNASEWLQYEDNFPTGTKFVAVRYNSNDMYSLYLDDFSFIVSDGFIKPVGLTASEITKNSVKLSWTEKGEATAWVVAYKADGAADFTEVNAPENPFTLTGLTPETEYTVKVRQAGETDKWSDEITFTTDVAFTAPTDLAVAPAATTAEVSWTGNADATSYNLRYREAPLGGTLTTDFEDSSLGEWTTIDADGDGFCWDLTTNLGNFSHHNESADCVTSGSYDSNAGALNPDNYLVSPQVLLGGSITFWACAQDASYAAEHFGVAVSTTSNTDPSAFTTIQEWTMTSAGTPSSRRKVAGTWGEYTVDLSAYAGQTGYVAIRHFNCSDFFYLNIDDITIEQPAGTEEPWTTVTGATSPYTIEGLTPETRYQAQVQAVYAEGESTWASTNFTTLEDVPTPTTLAVDEVGKRTATLSWTENGEATTWEICLNDDEVNVIKADSNPFTLEDLKPETEYTAKVRAIVGEKTSKWSAAVSFTTTIAFPAPEDLAAGNITSNSAEISWTGDADVTGAELQWAGLPEVTDPAEFKYDNGTFATAIGLGGGEFSWGVMFPAGSYTGNIVTKVSVYDSKAMTGSVTIYNDGDTAPENAVASVPVTFTGAESFIDINFDFAPIDNTKNVWVIFYNESGTDYPAACSEDELNDANGRWVEINGSWYDLAGAGVSGKCFMVRAEIGTVDLSAMTWTTVTDATSPVELTGLTPDTNYSVRVKSIYGTEGESEWATTFFTTLSANPVPYDIVADLAADGATLTWEGEGESYNVRYRTAGNQEVTFYDEFNSGLGNWTIYTEGEGPGWVIGTELGINAATAYSYENGVGSYAADNWLITPAVELDGLLEFYVATAPSYPDSYEVLLSTTGNQISDFTETLQAMDTATDGWVDIDLSAYAGQTGYIAIHHVSTDCYLLAVADFGIYGDYTPEGAWQEMAVTDKTATLTGLATNNAYEYEVQSVKGSDISEWSATQDFALLTLDSDADNTGLLYNNHGRQAYVTLANRTLYADGTWNTICLPFDLDANQLAASPLAGADFRTLSGITVNGNSVELNFYDQGSFNDIYAGYPWIIKWAAGGSNIENPEFANVIIDATLNSLTASDKNTDSGYSVNFVGTQAPKNFTVDNPSIAFIGENNALNYPLAGAKVGAFRGYFELNGFTLDGGTSVKIFTGDVDEDPTSIKDINDLKDNDDWYDLSGRKLAGKPSVKGIYVNGGRKVTVK